MRDFMLFSHLLGVFILLGGLGVAMTLGIRSESIEDVKVLKSNTDILTFNGRVVITAGLVISFIFGMALVSETGHEMSESWISISFVFWIIIIGLVHGVLVKGVKEIGARCDVLIEEGTETTTEFQGSDLSMKLRMVGIVVNVMTLVLLYLMVAQPGA